MIREGDCFNIPDESLVASVEAVPCSSPHDAEAFALFDIGTSASGYPGPSAVSQAAEDGCIQRFHAFVGRPYETSELYLDWLEPTEDSWNDLGDREIACGLVSGDGSQLTGSMRGSGK